MTMTETTTTETTLVVDPDTITMVLDASEATEDVRRAAIDAIAEALELEAERRGICVSVEREYRTTGRSGTDSLPEIWDAVLIGGAETLRAAVLPSAEAMTLREARRAAALWRERMGDHDRGALAAYVVVHDDEYYIVTDGTGDGAAFAYRASDVDAWNVGDELAGHPAGAWADDQDHSTAPYQRFCDSVDPEEDEALAVTVWRELKMTICRAGICAPVLDAEALELAICRAAG